MQQCACGCGRGVATGRRYVSGHNLKTLQRTDAHRKAIGDAQRRAWQTKRARMPLGSRYTDAHGYVRVKVVPGKGRWRLEHVLVMEQEGGPLPRGAIVHHINGIRDDNRRENLFLCRSHAEHMQVERSLAEAFRALMAAGLARFNPEMRCYEPTQAVLSR